MKSRWFLNTLFVLVVLAGCISPSQTVIPPSEIVTPSKTPTQVITHTPQASITETTTAFDVEELQYLGGIATSIANPTPTPLAAFDFREIIFFAGGGGAGDASECVTDPIYAALTTDNLPQVFLVNPYESATRMAYLCIYGFAPGEWVTMQVTTPDGKALDQFQRQSSEGAPFPYIDLLIGRSLVLPSGVWRVEAWSGEQRMQGEFMLGDEPEPAIGASRPLEGQSLNPLNPLWLSPFLPGETVVISGVSWKPDSILPVGIYLLAEPGGGADLPVMVGDVAHTDAAGAFHFTFTLDERFSAGRYAVIPFTEPGKLEYSIYGDVVTTFWLREPQNLCEGAPPSSIEIMDTVRVTAGQSNNLRETPTLSGKVVAKLLPYQDITVLDGPQCANGFTWWFVRDFYTGLEGWTAEGDVQGYWIVALR